MPRVTLFQVNYHQLDSDDVESYTTEYPTVLEAQKALERQHFAAMSFQQGYPVVWAWPGKRRDEVLRRARDAEAEGSKVEFLPDEVWIVGEFGVLRRYAPVVPPWKLK